MVQNSPVDYPKSSTVSLGRRDLAEADVQTLREQRLDFLTLRRIMILIMQCPPVAIKLSIAFIPMD